MAKKNKKTEITKTNIKQKTSNNNTNYFSIIAYIIIVIIGAICYLNSLKSEFQFDDNSSIVEYGWEYKSISDVFDETKKRFIGTLSFGLNYAINGKNVEGYHIFNIVIHLINALLIFVFIRITLNTYYSVKNYLLPEAKVNIINYLSLFTALIFVVHPIQTQAVTYTVQRFESIASLFYLLSMIFYIKAKLNYTDKNFPKILFILFIISALLGMMTKEITVTLPIMLLLYDFIFIKDKEQGIKDWIKSSKLFFITLIVLLIVVPLLLYIDFKSGTAKAENIKANIDVFTYLFTQFSVILTYIKLIFFPVNQSLDYDYPLSQGFFTLPTMLSFLILLGIIAFAIWYYKKNKLVTFFILWFFIILIPTSSILPIIDVIYEHRVYLGSMGIIFLILFFILNIFKTNKILLTSIFILICFILITLTINRNETWKTQKNLWNDVIKKSPNKQRGYVTLGKIFKEENNYQKALELYKTGLSKKPHPASIHRLHYNYANLLVALGKPDEAINEYNQAIEEYKKIYSRDAEYLDALNNLAIEMSKKALYKETLDLVKRMYKEDKNYLDATYKLSLANYNYGWWLTQQNKFAQAEINFVDAIKLNNKLIEQIDKYYISLNRKNELISIFNKLLNEKDINPNLTNYINSRIKR